ncbi:hypothetical protein BGZ94_001406 [Podila epigama]|nr:hypothetical protein BGZ94_001406 [Podila epigama]
MAPQPPLFKILIPLIMVLLFPVSSEPRPLEQRPLLRHTLAPCRIAHFDKLVVFGDSFSDSGNVYRLSNHTWPRDHFYYEGRFSNGPVWPDYVAKDKDMILDNYAYGSATTDSDIVQGKTGIDADLPVPGFIQQIQIYIDSQQHQQQQQQSASSQIVDLSSTLFVVSLQGNDFWFDPTIDTQVVMGGIEKGIHQLVDLGAQNILVFENFDMGQIPAFGGNSTLAKEKSAVAAKQYREYQDMKQRMAKEYGPVPDHRPFDDCKMGMTEEDGPQQIKAKTKVAFFDLYHSFLDVNRPEILEQLGITNTTHGCVTTDYESRCADASEYLFYDSFHPTTKVHRAFANDVLKLI